MSNWGIWIWVDSYQLILPTLSIQKFQCYVAGISLFNFYIQLYKLGMIFDIQILFLVICLRTQLLNGLYTMNSTVHALYTVVY